MDARIPVTIYRGKHAVSLETSDVSFKGLFVLTTEPPPLRSLVRLAVALRGGEFEVHAMAVHVVAPGDTPEDREPGVGLQFWGLSGSHRAAWDTFVGTLVHARRPATAPTPPAPAEAAHPASSEPAMPSGVRIVVSRAPLASSK